MNESFWDAHGVDIGTCALFAIFTDLTNFPGPTKNDGFDALGVEIEETFYVGRHKGHEPMCFPFGEWRTKD